MAEENKPAPTPPAPEPVFSRADVDRAAQLAVTTAVAERLRAIGLDDARYARMQAVALKDGGWKPEFWDAWLSDENGDAAPARDDAPEPKTEEGKRFAIEAARFRERAQAAEQQLAAVAAERDRAALGGELSQLAEKLGSADAEALAAVFLPRLKRIGGLSVLHDGDKPLARPVEEAVKEWLTANPARQKAQIQPGAGSRPANASGRPGAQPPGSPDLRTPEGRIEHYRSVGLDKLLRGEEV
jgi:hypothetical protein